MAEDTDTKLDDHVQSLADQGFAIEQGWPLNLRLRAEALSKAGKTEDPAGLVTPEHIAETGARLSVEEAEQAEADDKARRAVADLRSQPKSDLVEQAAKAGIAVDPKATKSDVVDAIIAGGGAAAAPASQEG